MNLLSPTELAEEARVILEHSWATETSADTFKRLIHEGFINAEGQVTKLLGGDAEPEPEAIRRAS